MEGHENSGGFMIARTYAEMVAALSDEEAGRTLKGLVYEFWGCGEKTAVSDSPVINALYNSIVQTAKEIDSNYQAQREQKREAGRKSAKLRTALNGVEQRSNDVQLNKSKVKESKEKEKNSNESKVSESKSAPSAVLTAEQRNLLIEKYGKAAADYYEERFERWKAGKKAFNGNAFTTVSKWIEEDKPKKKSCAELSSFDAADIGRAVAERYKKLE